MIDGTAVTRILSAIEAGAEAMRRILVESACRNRRRVLTHAFQAFQEIMVLEALFLA
jgi:hypothetical protein